MRSLEAIARRGAPPSRHGGAHLPGRARGPARAPRRPRGATCDLLVERDDPGGGAPRPGALLRRLLRGGRVHRRRRAARILAAARGARPGAAHPRRRAGLDGRRRAGGGAGRALRRPPALRLRGGHGAPWPAPSCVATLLPAAAFYLRLGRYAPARALIDGRRARGPGHRRQPRRRALALAALRHGRWAASRMGLSLEEALAAVTVNAAYSLDLARRGGQPGGGQARRPRGAALGAPARPRARRRARHPHGGQGRPGRGATTARRVAA